MVCGIAISLVLARDSLLDGGYAVVAVHLLAAALQVVCVCACKSVCAREYICMYMYIYIYVYMHT